MRSTTAKIAVVKAVIREGDREIAAIEHHHEGKRHGGCNPASERADDEPDGCCPVGGSDFVEAVRNKIESDRQQDREQRERDRAVELSDTQVR